MAPTDHARPDTPTLEFRTLEQERAARLAAEETAAEAIRTLEIEVRDARRWREHVDTQAAMIRDLRAQLSAASPTAAKQLDFLAGKLADVDVLTARVTRLENEAARGRLETIALMAMHLMKDGESRGDSVIRATLLYEAVETAECERIEAAGDEMEDASV